jgi:nitrogen regulatory protein P-II 1
VQLITAVVPSTRVGPIMTALRLFGVRGLTLSWVYIIDAAGAEVEVYRGVSRRAALSARARLDILAPNDDTRDLVRVIIRAGVPKSRPATPLGVWITPVDEVVRISSGEHGLAAL